MKKLLKSDQFVFNKEAFPEKESDDDAHENCDNDEGLFSCLDPFFMFKS